MLTIKNSIRKIALGVLVAGLAVVGSAFTNSNAPNYKETSPQWFQLTVGGSAGNADDYEQVDSPTNCDDGAHVCAILTIPLENSDLPDLSMISQTVKRSSE